MEEENDLKNHHPSYFGSGGRQRKNLAYPPCKYDLANGPWRLRLQPHLTVMIWPQSRLIPFIWAMKMAATASYSAVPSMLMVAPTGRTKRVTLLSMPRFSSKHRNVTGKVPALQRPNQTGRRVISFCKLFLQSGGKLTEEIKKTFSKIMDCLLINVTGEHLMSREVLLSSPFQKNSTPLIS